jgi:hypothetical protein
MSTQLRIVHVNHVPKLSEKLGVLATIQMINGSAEDLWSEAEFEDLTTRSRWRLTSVAAGTPPDSATLAVAFKKVSGNGDLSTGTELQRVAEAST